MRTKPLEDFWTYVDKSAGEDACWIWVGAARNAAGYGCFRAEGKTWVAHRWLMGHLRGSHLTWPAEIACHRCDNKKCVNPAHIYVGDHAANTADAIERSGHPAAQRSRTHCRKGHEFTPENTAWYGKKAVVRHCLACHRIKSNENRKKALRAKGIKVLTKMPDGSSKWIKQPPEIR